MIDRLKTKQEIRREIEQDVGQFLNGGGRIEQIRQGVSGREGNQPVKSPIPFSRGARQTRTPLTDTIRQLDQRKIKNQAVATANKQPTKKIVYDDFGEPVREVWE